MPTVKTRAKPMAFGRKLLYTGGIVIPSLLVASGCGSEPAPPPPEASARSVDDLKDQMEGIELGTEVSPPTEYQGGGSNSSRAGSPAEEPGGE